VVATLKGHEEMIGDLALSQDGSLLASASHDNTIKVWDTRATKERATLRGHEDNVLAVAITPTGKALISASRDQTLRVWNGETGKEARRMGGKPHVARVGATTALGNMNIPIQSPLSLACSTDKLAASAGENGLVEIWDIGSGAKLAEFYHSGTVYSIAFS